MPTMPSRLPAGQLDGPATRRAEWFRSQAGQALIESESEGIRTALEQRPGQSWLWLAPVADASGTPRRGLRLFARGEGWGGPIRCATPLPLANESVAMVVIQHALRPGDRGRALIDECARVLVPGGHLWLYALNPLSPYRWRWKTSGLRAAEPGSWRRRLRAVGLQPDGMSQGMGPVWRIQADASVQQGPGLRAAYLLRAEKRSIPLTPLRLRAQLRLGEGVPAA
jgi:SAM-dependent methyltransferase